MMKLRPVTIGSLHVGLSTLWKRYLREWKDSMSLPRLSLEETIRDLTPTLAEALIWKAIGGANPRRMWLKPRCPLTKGHELVNFWRKESESA